MIVTGGTTADCSQAAELVDGLAANFLMADKACDTNALLQWCTDNAVTPVIPPKANRTEKRDHDKYLQRLRHLIENAFLKLKQWRSIATSYAKTTATFLAERQIAASMLWTA